MRIQPIQDSCFAPEGAPAKFSISPLNGQAVISVRQGRPSAPTIPPGTSAIGGLPTAVTAYVGGKPYQVIPARRNTGKTEGKAAFLLAATRVVPIQAMCERSGQS